MFRQLTYYYHILTCEPAVKEWLITNGILPKEVTDVESGNSDGEDDDDDTPGQSGLELQPTGDYSGASIECEYGSAIRERPRVPHQKSRNDREVHAGQIIKPMLQQPTGAILDDLRKSPWKLFCLHKRGPRCKREHLHIIYVSTSKQWGHNSAFGRIIRANQYKCESITCLSCLVEYLLSGNGRIVFKNTIGDNDRKNCRCAFHSMANNEERQDGEGEDAERRTTMASVEGIPQAMGDGGMGSPVGETDDMLPTTRRRRMVGEQTHICDGEEPTPGLRRSTMLQRGRASRTDDISNAKLVLLFCDERAFNEGDGERILTKTPEGIELLFKYRANERIKTAITVARILVFSETLKKRVERCRDYQLRLDPECKTEFKIQAGVNKLMEIIRQNDIDVQEFATNTYMHLSRQTGKKNNLFFMGPPSTGKTMIMESLVAIHYNFARLTGLTPGSSFNFASLTNVNACFMDECKLTDNQFEQWKLLAAGSPMCTDVKYKERHNIENCVLYTCANHSIATYVQVPEAYKAIDTRTIQYNFTKQINEYTTTSVFVWERLWEMYGHAV